MSALGTISTWEVHVPVHGRHPPPPPRVTHCANRTEHYAVVAIAGEWRVAGWHWHCKGCRLGGGRTGTLHSRWAVKETLSVAQIAARVGRASNAREVMSERWGYRWCYCGWVRRRLAALAAASPAAMDRAALHRSFSTSTILTSVRTPSLPAVLPRAVLLGKTKSSKT